MNAGQASRTRSAREGSTWSEEGLAAVVISGAGARGAYEAGVLATLLPALFPRGLSEVMLLGTSAGAINATLWTQLATPGRPLAEVGEEVCKFWQELDVDQVYSPIALTALRRALLLDWIGNFDALLDTAPSRVSAQKTFRADAIASNVTAGSVAGVGVVATTCPLDASGGRSRVFFQASSAVTLPEHDIGGALDYVPVSLTHEHVLASAAIPSLFPAVHVSTPRSEAGYYCDGGLRLNTPIEPAIALGAKRLVVVSSHATTYPPPGPLRDEMPDVVDLAAQAMHAALADAMIEDLRSLRRINELVLQAQERDMVLMNNGVSPPRPYMHVPLVEVSSQPGALAQLAAQVFRSKPPLSLRGRYRRLEYQILRRWFAGLGAGPGNDELLSYLFFDAEFARRQIVAGKEAARATLDELAARGMMPSPVKAVPVVPVVRA